VGYYKPWGKLDDFYEGQTPQLKMYPYLLETANINASNCKQANFETTLTANRGGLKTTLDANEITFGFLATFGDLG
jgi:hypothetical protein